jgi:hypothetical protein
MKNKSGLLVALLGIVILGCIIGYQAKTQTSAIIFMPIGLGVTFVGVFMIFRSAAKSKQSKD